MKKISIILGSALLMLTGCATDLTQDVAVNSSKKTIGVTLDATRTALGDKAGELYSVVWSEGDQIAVNGVVSAAVAADFVGKTAADFVVEGTIAAPYEIIYPAHLVKAAGQITISENQAYAAGSFANATAVMVGKSDDAKNVVLKNLNGFVKVTILKEAAEELSYVTLASNDGEALSGVFTVDFEAGEMTPVAGYDFVKVTDVEYDSTDVATVVFAVPAINYAKGFTVKAVTKAGVVCTKTAYSAGKDIEAGKMLAMPEFVFEQTDVLHTIDTADQLLAFVDAVNIGDYAAFKNDEGEVCLGADLDFTGKQIKSITTWDGVFNGNGYAIKNLTSDGTPLFTQITTGGVVKNVHIDASCSMVFDAEGFAKGGNRSFLVGECFGLISGCVNDADITFDDPSADIWIDNSQIKLGALCGVVGDAVAGHEGSLIENCINNGNVYVNFGSMVKNADNKKSGTLYVAGITGNSKGFSGVQIVKNNVNNGNVTVYIDGENGWNNCYVGGVCSCCNNNGDIYGNINNGNVTWTLNHGDTGAYPNVGGITGYSAAAVTNCKNTGDISINAGEKGEGTKAITRPALGGIAGYVNHTVSGCENYGNVRLNGGNSTKFGSTTSYTAGGVGNMGHPVVGGVCGSVGYPAEGSVSRKARTIENCTNYGTVSAYIPQNATWVPVAGIVALYAGEVKNCENYGTIKMEKNGSQCYVGGVFGTTVDKSNTATDCTNYGKVWFIDSNAVALGKGTTRSYAGGVSGGYNAGSGNSLINCVNNGEVLAEAAQTMIVGGVAAAHNGTFENCVNNANVTMNRATAQTGYLSEVGGIVGYTNCPEASKVLMTGCASYGVITNNSDEGTDCGGLIGAIGGAKEIVGCTVGCVIAANGANAGYVLGSTRASASAVTLGSEEAPVVLKAGSVLNGVPATAADAADGNKLMGRFAAGSSLVLTNVVYE